MQHWINHYFNTLLQLQKNTRVTECCGQTISLSQGFEQYIHYAKATRQQGTKIIFIGNGGSAGIASHLAIDYSKNGNLPALAFSDAAAITCLSNDYGYEHVFAKQIAFHARKGDFLVAISSSGKSLNILNAVKTAQNLGCQVATFSGFDPMNPLAQLGDLNFYVDSAEYGFVEVAHLSLNHALLDYITEEQKQKIPQHSSIEAVI